MQKAFTTAVFTACVMCAPCFAETFEDYKKSSESEFASYSDFDEYGARLMREFDEYKKIADEEFGKYAGRVKETWGDGLVSSEKVWVEYSPDMKKRRSVNFETGEITVQFRKEPSSSDLAAFKREITALLSETEERAVASDGVTLNVLRRLNSAGIKTENFAPSREPVLRGLIPPQGPAPAADRLISAGSESKVILPSGETAVTFRVFLEADEPAAAGFAPVLTAVAERGSVHKMAASFKNSVKKYAAERKIPEALIYAVIHNESSFNPLATSPVPAYGMMQLVPKSGAYEASALIFPKPKILSPAYLYNAENNVRLGAAYLSQLYGRYFKDVKDPESRLYCVVSAYNTGPSNVARALVGSKDLKKAAAAVNSAGPVKVYETLVKNLPYEETRKYLPKVAASYNAYAGF